MLISRKNLQRLGHSWDCALNQVRILYCHSIATFHFRSDPLFERATVAQHLQLFCALNGFNQIEISNFIPPFLKLFGLSDFMDERVGNLSGGNKRRLSTAIAIFKFPNILLFDEPTCGIDPRSRHDFWNIISYMTEIRSRLDQRAVVLSSHSMSECEALCHKVAVLCVR